MVTGPASCAEAGGELAAQPRLRALLVEDEPTIAITLADDLEEAGCSVVVDHSGEIAIAKLREVDFDWVVTDLRMPNIDGVEIVRAARELRPRARIVVVTAHATPETVITLRQLGIVDVVHKPFDNGVVVGLMLGG